MQKHVDITHVTLQVGSYSLHIDSARANWYPTKRLDRAYARPNGFRKLSSVVIGYSSVYGYPLPPKPFSTVGMIAWWCGGKTLFPKWRPNNCVKGVIDAAYYYGWSLPNVAYTDELFDKIGLSIPCK